MLGYAIANPTYKSFQIIRNRSQRRGTHQPGIFRQHPTSITRRRLFPFFKTTFHLVFVDDQLQGRRLG